MMKTYVSAAVSNVAQYVNKVGKYLNKNIDGAFRIQFAPMECSVTMRMYYQVPGEPDTLDELHFIISITSYANKLRINLTEDTNMEKTIGQLIIEEADMFDMPLIKKKVLEKLKKAIATEFSEYDFVY